MSFFKKIKNVWKKKDKIENMDQFRSWSNELDVGDTAELEKYYDDPKNFKYTKDYFKKNFNLDKFIECIETYKDLVTYNSEVEDKLSANPNSFIDVFSKSKKWAYTSLGILHLIQEATYFEDYPFIYDTEIEYNFREELHDSVNSLSILNKKLINKEIHKIVTIKNLDKIDKKFFKVDKLEDNTYKISYLKCTSPLKNYIVIHVSGWEKGVAIKQIKSPPNKDQINQIKKIRLSTYKINYQTSIHLKNIKELIDEIFKG